MSANRMCNYSCPLKMYKNVCHLVLVQHDSQLDVRTCQSTGDEQTCMPLGFDSELSIVKLHNRPRPPTNF